MAIFIHRLPLKPLRVAVLAGLCLLPGVISSGSAVPPAGSRDAAQGLDDAFPGDDGLTAARSEAEMEFADAPFGVDPTVTGPVSTAFRQTQQTAGCDTAKWPDIPAECYPD